MAELRPCAEVLAGYDGLPLATPADFLAGRRGLILAPHADDESLGCGGLIAAASVAGLAPVVVILTDGAASHPGSVLYPPDVLARLRAAEAAAAVSILGLPGPNLRFLHYADTGLPRAGEEFDLGVGRLARIARAEGCSFIAAPWEHDPHCDHVAAAVMAAAVAARTGLPLFSYPVWGWLLPPETLLDEPRRQGWRLDITNHLSAKRAAIAAHASQYGALIPDSPNGFRLPAELLAVFDRPYEVLLSA